MTTSQISLPNPRTWSPGDYVLVPRLRADLSDAAALLLRRPMAVLQCSTGFSPPGGGGVVPMDTTLADTWGGHLADVSPAFFGLQADYWGQLAGWYLCDARMPFIYSSGTAAAFLAGWTGNINGGSSYGPFYGAAAANGSGAGTTARAVDLIEMTVLSVPNGGGDFIAPWASSGAGGGVALNTSGQNLPTASIRWICATSGTRPLPVPPLTPAPSPITSAWLNANLRDAVRFLTYPPAAKAHYTAGSSTLANTTLASPAVVPLTTVDLDTYGGMTTGANAKYTAPVSGRYLVAGQVNLASSSTTTWYACGVLVNGSTQYWGGIVRFAGSSLAGGAGITKRIRLNAGDTVQLIAAQASGGSIAYHTAAANQTRLIVVWEGI
ncbi:MAG TPA: hypothetical protein VFB06_29510 [Streptosporangiaceae bacterium]|nr:hypothetical protein [Streptosporangiaceae bacterium]